MPRTDLAARQRGITLIELLVAMVLGILVSAGVISVFLSTSASNKAQRQMAAIQETGRFAMGRLKSSLRMVNGAYCVSTGGGAFPTAGGMNLSDRLVSPVVYSRTGIQAVMDDLTTPYTVTPTKTYALPPYLFMRGYDCGTSSCTPVDPAAAGGIPAQGTAVGNRVVGSDVLTVRYVDGSMGWSIGRPGGSSITASTDGTQIVDITLVPLTGEPAVSEFDGSVAMLANCSMTEVFTVNGALAPVAAANFGSPNPMTGTEALRVFDFKDAFKTVSYYLGVVNTGNGRTTGALYRRLNGQNQELVRGLERLDFRYGVIDQNGMTRYLTANQVDAGSALCAATVDQSLRLDGTSQAGCLWRAVKSIEASIVVDGQRPLYTLTDNELTYTYGPDGANTPTQPSSHNIRPHVDQGFPKELLRREFTALIAVRNYNP